MSKPTPNEAEKRDYSDAEWERRFKGEAATSAAENQACENTDRELWREREGDYYADSIRRHTIGRHRNQLWRLGLRQAVTRMA